MSSLNRWDAPASLPMPPKWSVRQVEELQKRLVTWRRDVLRIVVATGTTYVILCRDSTAPADWGLWKVYGCSPAFTYFFRPVVSLEGFDRYPENQKAFWQVIEDSHATYFCGHEHIFNLSQPAKAAGGHAWQVMVGSGGSPFTAKPGESSKPEDRYYAWAVVQVHQSGKVHLDAWGFSDTFGSTRKLGSFELETQ